MIYLNNAATSYKKPKCVYDSINNSLQDIPVGQFRSNFKNNNIINECKTNISKIIHNNDSGEIYFTSGATEAANLVINGINLENKHVLISSNEHNCIIRPLYNCFKNAQIEILNSDYLGLIDIDNIEEKITKNTKAIFVNHCSNVTGIIQDIEKIGKIAKKHNLIYIVDASQSAGCINIDVEKAKIDILIFTAHKSLFGISGLGGFYLRKNVELKLVKFGGTANNSQNIIIDKKSREFEVGTQNILAITALKHSTDFILNKKIEDIINYEKKLIDYLYKGLKTNDKIILFSDESYNRGPLLSFNIKGLDSSDVGYILEHTYETIVRVGLHCAPLIHKQLKTFPKGSVRVSISMFTTIDEIEQFIENINEITKGLI